jgi:hypothetical protein
MQELLRHEMFVKYVSFPMQIAINPTQLKNDRKEIKRNKKIFQRHQPSTKDKV